MNRSFTIFFTDNCELQAVQPIGRELENRGCSVRYTNNVNEPADVGIYCHHAAKPNARFSVIMLHDLAQRHDIWPEFWFSEPWTKFDIALIPGKAWEERWASQSHLEEANPKLGVFKVGWPKSDLIFAQKSEFQNQTAALRKSLNLTHEKTILYAPSWENDRKQDDFVQRLKDLPVNLLLKQAPWPAHYPQVLRNIEEMDNLHRGMADNIHVVDREISIMYCIGISDLLVSDESSVLIEASLYEVPSIAVTDWTIPDTHPPRPACVPFENVRKIPSSDLRKSVEELIGGSWDGRVAARSLRDLHFSELGQSSRLTVDLILAAVQGAPLPIKALERVALVENEPDLAVHEEAVEKLNSGRIEEALALLTQLASRDTKCWQVFNTLGEFSYKQNNHQAAMIFFEAAVQKSKRNAPALKNLAFLQAKTGDVKNAILSYGQVLRIQPMDLEAIDSLGRLIFKGDSLQNEVWHRVVDNLRGH